MSINPASILFDANHSSAGCAVPLAGSNQKNGQRSQRAGLWRLSGCDPYVVSLLILVISVVLAGCGSGGFAGGGITDLSSSAFTIDAGQSFQVTAGVSGSNTMVSWSMAGSSCSATACGSLSNLTGIQTTYTAPAGLTSQMKLTLTASVSGTSSLSKASITVNPAPVISGVLPNGTVGAAYSAAMTVAGGTAPLKWSLVGALPAGLTFDATTATIKGTPTTPGTASFTAQVLDSSAIPETVTAGRSISITTPALGGGLSVTGNPPAGKVGIPYATMLTAAGGVAPYSWSIVAGALPAGLTLSPLTGVISGTPSAQGASTFTVQVEDALSEKASAPFVIDIGTGASPLTLTLPTLPGATVGVPYSATIGVSGGTPAYSCLQVGGILPAGLTLSANCVVSGTPTVAGPSTFMVKASDSGSPTETITGPESITVSAAASLVLTAPPSGTIGVPYTGSIGVTGGTAPYTCVLSGGALPAGLTLGRNCFITGTPTSVGTASFTVTVTDAGNPAKTATGTFSLTISPAALTLTLTSLPNATVGIPYTATIGVSGGTAPYNCVILSGTLPAGLSITGCVVSGTPTIAGSVSLTIKAIDSSVPQEMAVGPVGLTVLPNSMTITITSPPGATVGVPYSGPIGVTGGTAPYICTQVSGTLPAGLSLTGCIITGTPTTPGTGTIIVKVTDTSSPVNTKTGPVTVTVSAATVTLTLTSPPSATIGVPYMGTIGVMGGTAPYTCNLALGSLPAGLTLASNCVVSGTPADLAHTIVQVHVTDSATPFNATTGPVTITVLPVPTLTLTGTLPKATLNVPYTQTLLATGGITPYTYSISLGALPAGLTLSDDGVISGTPTVVGASSFTVTVTDTETTPQMASLPLVLQVVYPVTPPDGELVGPYAFLFQGYDDVLAGVLAYQTAAVGSFTADGTGGLNAGELDANHQDSVATGNTISSNQFLGTYTLGTDNRGFMTFTLLNADGTTGGNVTFAITVKAPVLPSTIAAEADLIEFDGNNLQGTRGSGSMLAQTASSFAAGLHGSYAFGLSGDTPCLPSCTIGIIAGPAASVGQFATDGAGSLTGGTSDANIATTNYANENLTGTYETADGNGRLGLSMTTAGTPAAGYPTDYAVYLVNANQAFILSTDKHSDYVLLAGSAQLQTQASFDNTSLNGAFIGYENAQSNPGLLGVVLQNTLNLSTATIFRTTADSLGTCNITNVDTAGLTGLIDGLTGLGSGLPILEQLLGSYQATGTSACTVAANGRGVLNYPVATLLGIPIGTAPAPRELYLFSPNNGYFLETGYAGLGKFEAQTGAPFSLATLDGTYVYASQAAASLASINTSGTFVADGAGNATTTTDLNVGVGNINLLELDTTNTATYAIAPTDIQAGRFTFGTNVLYAISPSRFVLIDTNVLTTSPSVSLLY